MNFYCIVKSFTLNFKWAKHWMERAHNELTVRCFISTKAWCKARHPSYKNGIHLFMHVRTCEWMSMRAYGACVCVCVRTCVHVFIAWFRGMFSLYPKSFDERWRWTFYSSIIYHEFYQTCLSHWRKQINGKQKKKQLTNQPYVCIHFILYGSINL